MKKFLCVVLAALMLLSSTTLLFSCKKEEKDTSTNNAIIDRQLEEGTVFYERAQVSDNLPEKDFGGRSFRIATPYEQEVYVSEDQRGQGDLIVDAKYTRNLLVEQRFNAKIEIVYSGLYNEVTDYAKKTILSNSDEFDLLIGQSLNTANTIKDNIWLNWYDVPYINFDQPWWFESAKENLTYDGKALLAISHLNHTAVSGITCMYFNKELAASYELGDLYSIVLSGNWTYDKLQTLVKDIYRDENGNSVRDEGDLYGFAQSRLNSYLWAFDNPICKKDESGKPVLAIKTDKIDSIINSIYDMCYNVNGSYYDPTGKTTGADLFYKNKAIFMFHALDEATTENLRNFESDYGILPLPKYDSTQQNYSTMVDGYHSVLAVPKTAKDLEFIGIMVEALSAESWKTVTPSLYEVALKNRYLRDDSSKEVMDIVINNVMFDFGYIYNIGLSYIVGDMMKAGNNNFTSQYNKMKTNANYELKQVIKAFDKL